MRQIKESPTLRKNFHEGAKVSQQEIATPASCNTLPRKRRLRYTQKITYTATLTAVALVIKATVQAIFASLPLIHPTLTYIPWIIAGIILDPVCAAIVGFASDSLGMLIIGAAASINPIMALSCALFPCIVSLCVRFLPIKHLPIKALIGTAMSALVCTMFLSTFGLYIYTGIFMGVVDYQKPFFVLMAARLPQLLFIAICTVAVGALLPVMNKLNLLPEPYEAKKKKSDGKAEDKIE